MIVLPNDLNPKRIRLLKMLKSQNAVVITVTFQESLPRLSRGRSLNAIKVPITVATEPATKMSSKRPVSVIILLHTAVIA